MCHPLLLELEHRLIRLALAGEPPLEGYVHVATPGFLLVRTSEGGWRVIHAGEPPAATWD
jgi:hypothetical protein